MNINAASQAALAEWPGVGEATAKQIITGRPYQAVGDLSDRARCASRLWASSGARGRLVTGKANRQAG